MINFRMRKFFARLALPFVFVFLVVTPAYSLIGLVPLVIRMGGSAALGTGVEVSALIHLAALGVSLPFIEINDPASQISVRIPTTEGQPVPAPSAPPTEQATGGETVYCWGFPSPYGQYCGDSGQNAIESCSAAPEGVWIGGRCYATIDGVGVSTVNVGTSTAPISCPSGYVTDGAGGCSLSNAREVTPDNACDYSNNGSALSQISDPDCSSAPSGVDCSSGACVITSLDAFQQPRRITVTVSPGGGATIEEFRQRVVNNTPVVDRTTVGISPGGTVTTIGGGTNTGTIPSDGSAPTPGTDVPVVNVDFPSDYARSGDAQSAANSLAPKIDRIGDALSSSEVVTDPTVPLDSDMPEWGNTFGGLTGWQLPGHASACPSISLDLSMVFGAGSVYATTDHCGLIQDNFGVIQAAMALVWTLLAMMIVLRA